MNKFSIRAPHTSSASEIRSAFSCFLCAITLYRPKSQEDMYEAFDAYFRKLNAVITYGYIIEPPDAYNWHFIQFNECDILNLYKSYYTKIKLMTKHKFSHELARDLAGTFTNREYYGIPVYMTPRLLIYQDICEGVPYRWGMFNLLENGFVRTGQLKYAKALGLECSECGYIDANEVVCPRFILHNEYSSLPKCFRDIIDLEIVDDDEIGPFYEDYRSNLLWTHMVNNALKHYGTLNTMPPWYRRSFEMSCFELKSYRNVKRNSRFGSSSSLRI